ncbi:MAG: ATP-binding cassette domain-containing protein [Eudoraea sp.]|nr:ATP-binding cassette domain-containing protein [Eudoraea sp.]
MIDLQFHKKLIAAEGDLDLDISLNIQKGELITLYGPSGVGKTSCLRILAGLMAPDRGLIKVEDTIWFNSETKKNSSPQERSVGFLFQDYALFPNMTVRENLEFALKKGQQKDIITELIDVIELGDLQHRNPMTLSGGQKQRVALARALVHKPQILLLDEPLAALDYHIRQKLQTYIYEVHKEFSLTTILISHDIGEIIKLSDRVIVLEHGKIIKEDSPQEIFMSKQLSGKFQFTGEIIAIEKEEVIYIVTVLIHNSLIKVVADASEVASLTTGDKVVVASKAFNPILYKIE